MEESRLLDFSSRDKNLETWTEVSAAPGTRLVADPSAELDHQSWTPVY